MDIANYVSKTLDFVMTRRTMRFPGSLLYYLFFGGYLAWLGLLERAAPGTGKRRVVERLRWTDLSSYLSWVFRHVGLPSSCSIVFESRLLGIIGVIEPTMSEFLRSKHGEVFVDVGAYHGHYSLLLSGNFDKVIALEPVPMNYNFLTKVIAYRRVRNIKPIQSAAGIDDGIRQIDVMPQPSESKFRSLASKQENTISVSSLSLHSLLRHYSRIDLVKLDVEGAEMEVLRGTRNSIESIRSWLIELHEQSWKSNLENLLTSHDYKLFWIDKGHLYASRQVAE